MNNQRPQQGGYVLIINALIFLAVSFFVIGAAAGPLVASNRATSSFVDSTEAFMIASSAAEEALYKMKSQMSIGSSETLTLGDQSAEINVATGLDDKTITVSADVESYVRALEIRVAESVGVSFNYGLQVGKGGFDMAGGAGIYGNVYANGDIVGSGGPFITGSATVANRSNPVADQSNSGATPPAAGVSFGANDTPQDLAQSFAVTTTTPVTSVRLYMRRSSTAWMNDITVRLTTDNGGKPSKTTLASANLGHAQITTAYNYLSIPFTSAVVLTPGTTYWIVLDTGTTWGSSFSVAATQATYASGVAKTGTWSSGNGGTWADTSPAGRDLYFDIYVGGETGRISGVTVGQSGGDAWAHRIESATIHGTAYCQSSQSTNKACNTSRPDPVEQPMPISDGNIDSWKAEAEAGGTQTGNVTIGPWPTVNVTMGPRKIVGNLTVTSSGVH